MLVDYWIYFYKNKVFFYFVGVCNCYFNGVLKIDFEIVWYKKYLVFCVCLWFLFKE